MDVSGQGFVLELRRSLRSPRAQVFDALVDPAALAAWWGPAGFTTPEIAVDAVVGGSYRFGMQPPDGELFHLTGHYVEIERPHRLVYTFRWEEPDPDDRDTVAELVLHETGDGTDVALTHGPFLTEARLELHRQGWTDSFDRLAGFLESSADRPRG